MQVSYPTNLLAAQPFSSRRDMMQSHGPNAFAHDPVLSRTPLDLFIPTYASPPSLTTISTPSRYPHPSALRFGAIQPYKGPYNNLRILTDFQDQTSNARVYQRFQVVQDFVSSHRPTHQLKEWFKNARNPERRAQAEKLSAFHWNQSDLWSKESRKGTLDHTDIADIPLRNIDSAAQSLFELAKEPNKDVFIHVTDPGVGSGKESHKRSILVSRNHGVHVGPNNGSLGLLSQFLAQRHEPFELLEIDIDRVNQLEAIRTGKTSSESGSTFHGRDVFAVVAGAIAGGLDPRTLAKNNSIASKVSEFAQGGALPLQPGISTDVRANIDNTSGNLVLNVALTPEEFTALGTQKAKFQLTANNDRSIALPVKRTFGEVRQGEPLLYLGSKFAPEEGRKYLEAALNCDNMAQRLRLGRPESAVPLTLTRNA